MSNQAKFILAVAVLVAAAALFFALQADPAPQRDGAGTRTADEPVREPQAPAERTPIDPAAVDPREDVLEATRDEVEWDKARKELIAEIRRDFDRSEELLVALGAAEDEKAALRAARVLPFAHAKGFERRLIQSATGAESPLERRVAMVGLRGRGKSAAAAVTRVALEDTDPVVRAQATQELASHMADPAAIELRHQMLGVVSTNLEHEDAAIRTAALKAILGQRRQVKREIVDQVAKLAEEDPSEEVRRFAEWVLKRQAGD